MPAPKFLINIYRFASPSHRRAARERRREYEAKFQEHQEENANRIRRISQLRGDLDTSNFLYDSAHGTGAASRMSLQDPYAIPPYAPPPLPRASSGRPFSSMSDFTEPLPAAREFGSTSASSATSSLDAQRTVSVSPSVAAPTNRHSGIGSLGGRGPPSYDQIATTSPTTRSRPRPISLPAAMPKPPTRNMDMVNDWWHPSGLTPHQAPSDFVQVLSTGDSGDDRELRMSAMVA